MEPVGSSEFTSAGPLSLSSASSIQLILPHSTSGGSIFILSSHLRLGLPSGFFTTSFPTKTLYTPILSPINVTWPALLILLDIITRSNILLNSLFLKTFSLRSTHNVSEQVSHPYKTTGKVIISPGPGLTVRIFSNKTRFYGEELLGPCPTPKIEDHTLSAIRESLFDIFATTLHIGGRSPTRNPRSRRVVLTGNNLS